MKSVILVEDEWELSRLLVRVFSSEGYDVRAVLDGQQVGQLCQAQLPDLIVTDVAMPNKDGLEVIHELRQMFPKVKIIAMSGHFLSKDTLLLAETLGADFTFQKPFPLPDLLRAARIVLGLPLG